MFVVDAAAAAAAAADVSAGVGIVCSVAAAQNIATISGFPRTHTHASLVTRGRIHAGMHADAPTISRYTMFAPDSDCVQQSGPGLLLRRPVCCDAIGTV